MEITKPYGVHAERMDGWPANNQPRVCTCSHVVTARVHLACASTLLVCASACVELFPSPPPVSVFSPSKRDSSACALPDHVHTSPESHLHISASSDEVETRFLWGLVESHTPCIPFLTLLHSLTLVSSLPPPRRATSSAHVPPSNLFLHR